MTLFLIIISLIALQRIGELIYSNKNERKLTAKGAVIHDEKGYRYIVAMHIGFFIFLISEFFIFQRTLSNYLWILLPVFIIAQILRYWAVATLGFRWNTKVIVLPGSQRIKSGPYKYLNHPNYTAVVIEFAAIPLIFSCYITAVIFSILNFFALSKRIKAEEYALKINSA